MKLLHILKYSFLFGYYSPYSSYHLRQPQASLEVEIGPQTCIKLPGELGETNLDCGVKHSSPGINIPNTFLTISHWE